MAAGLSVDLDRWRHEFDELMLRVGARFAPRAVLGRAAHRGFVGVGRPGPGPADRAHLVPVRTRRGGVGAD